MGEGDEDLVHNVGVSEVDDNVGSWVQVDVLLNGHFFSFCAIFITASILESGNDFDRIGDQES